MSLLTERQRQILVVMRDRFDADEGDEDAELVYERGIAYLGNERIAARTVFALLRLCAISADRYDAEGYERYHINETGRQLLEDA